MAITRATLDTSIWDTINTYIKTTNPITNNTKIFSAYNDALLKDEGFPLIILAPPLCTVESESVNGQITKSEVKMSVSVYHNSVESMKVVVDDVRTKLWAGKATFSGDGLTQMKFEDVGYDPWQTPGRTVHMKEMQLSFRFLRDDVDAS